MGMEQAWTEENYRCLNCNYEGQAIVVSRGFLCGECGSYKTVIQEYECDGRNCPPRAHDHKVLI